VNDDEAPLWADQNSMEVWAPVHAWRALGQLRAEEAIKPLREYLLDSSNKELARATAANCLEKIGNKNSLLKNDCISILAEYLEQSTIDAPTLNGLVIAYLIELEA
jgi:HEAT repeat protein